MDAAFQEEAFYLHEFHPLLNHEPALPILMPWLGVQLDSAKLQNSRVTSCGNTQFAPRGRCSLDRSYGYVGFFIVLVQAPFIQLMTGRDP